MMQPTRWIVSQIGARQHYGIPRGFQQSQSLRLFYTDIWWPRGLPRASWSKPLAGLVSRSHPELPQGKVIAFSLGALAARCVRRTGGPAGIESEYFEYVRYGKWFGTKVAKHLARQKLDAEFDAFFGFNTGCLETLQMLREHHPRILTIVDQIDPGPAEEELVAEEARRWPGWQAAPGRVPGRYWDRLRAEWDLASLILVNSNWSKQALVSKGVPAEKLFVVPVAHMAQQVLKAPPTRAIRPFRVLWLGSVNLRKGIPYLVEAAKLLLPRPEIHIDVIGPIQITDHAVASAPANMTFHGRVPRQQADAAYREADVFVLPTISDGFAITQIEAMAQGLPVITTPNCGEVVTSGMDGIIVPIRDSAALANAIATLEADREMLSAMSSRAVEKAAHFSFEEQTQQIEQAVASYRANASRGNLISVTG